MPATNEPLLDLDTMVERPVVAIDGTKYEVLSADEISVLDAARFGRWGKRIKELGEATTLSEAEEAELDDLVDRLARKVLVDAPEEVFARLSGNNRWALVDLFTGLLLRRATRVAGAMMTAAGIEESTSLQTGATSSRDSSGSSVERPPTGLSATLLRWFGCT